MSDPTADLQLYVGGVVLAGVSSALGAALNRWLASGSQADAEWRAEMKTDIKAILSKLTELETEQRLSARDIASLTARMDALEKRQDAQAQAHRDAIQALRDEMRGRAPREA
ncbi:MAG: hypothetical protein SFW67_35495 [Myxococcaceae bacterium]|nr:hypothetical protein [Myxococcaceae bacterium]